MSMNALHATQSYAQAARTAFDASVANSAPSINKPDFAELMEATINETTQTLKAGEVAATQVAAGDANLVDVATAISSAETSLETAIAVRNRMIEAYQEIMRMPI